MKTRNTINVKEAITRIQKRAFAASGMTMYDVQVFYKSEKERVSRFVTDTPSYLISREEMLKRDPSLQYLEMDLPKRFDTQVRGLPYQHPYMYSWLHDTLRYCNEKLGRTPDFSSSLIVASAPTGCFNAIAIPGREESGVLIEDGLLNVANNFSNKLAFLFYDKLNNGSFQERELEDLETYAEEHGDVLIYLADVIWHYVIDGYSYLPGPIGATSNEDFSIRHILSQNFIFFVLEHECFHIEWWRHNQSSHKNLFTGRFKQVWDFYCLTIAEALPEKLSPDEFERIYYAQQEELLADFFSFNAVIKLGEKENTYTASVKGALLFFMIAELIQHLLFRLDDTDFIDKFYTLDEVTLSLTAILTRQSHPYALLRKCNILSLVKQVHPKYFNSVVNESTKLDFISDKIKALLDMKVASAAVRPFPHPKWVFGKSIMEL